MIELCGEGYRSCGTTGRPSAEAAKDFIFCYLPGDENNAVSLEQIIETTSQPRATVQRALVELKNQNQLIEVGHGVTGDPYRYYLPGNDSAQNPSL